MSKLHFLSHWLYSQLFVTPPYPTHDFTGQAVILTGSNTGLGLEAARHFARLNCAKLILAVRTLSKGEKAKESILASTKRTSGCIEVWNLDLPSTASVKAFATRAQQLDRLDVLEENVGILHSPTFTATADGNEIELQTNLRETGKKFNGVPHLVVVTSEMHHTASFKEKGKDDIYAELNDEKAYAEVGNDKYGVTKLLELLLVSELAKRISSPPVITGVNLCFCYGDIARDIKGIALYFASSLRWILARSTEVGSRTLLAGACAGSYSHGQYMADSTNQERVEWMATEEGARLQRRVFKQTIDVLKKIEPGIWNNV